MINADKKKEMKNLSEMLLETRNLTKQYGHHKAVDSVNMHIKKGAIYGFIGRNGAGKTTCLKMISGLSKPTCGEIEMFGYKGKDLQKVRSRIGCLIEAPGLYGNMTAYENLNIKCKLFGIKKKSYIEEILRIIGDSFVSNRLMSIFLISFPIIAVLERYGLKERAAYLIGQIKKATAGKVLAIYLLIRTIAAAFSVRLGGHVQFVRPLIYPMAEAAGEKCKGSLFTEKETDFVKGLAAAAENYGNFFGQNCFYGASGVLLIQGVLIEAGYEVTLQSIALNSIPVAVIMFVLALIQFHFADKKIRRDGMM